MTYDGKRLSFPTSDGKDALEQAARNAKHLTEILSSSVGENVQVKPVLTFPGWYVDRTREGTTSEEEEVIVLNPKRFTKKLLKSWYKRLEAFES